MELAIELGQCLVIKTKLRYYLKGKGRKLDDVSEMIQKHKGLKTVSKYVI